MKKRVAYLITKATRGGAQRYVYDLATNLPKMFEPVVAYGTEGRLSRDLATAGVETRRLPSLDRDIAIVSDIKSFFGIMRFLKETRPEALHLNSSKAAGLGALAARLVGIKNIIFTVHGWPFKEERGIAARAIIYAASWLTAVLSHKIIVVSSIDEGIARGMWFLRGKVHYIRLGLAQSRFAKPEEAYRAMFGALQPAPLRPSTARIATIAELTKNKGLRYGIEAVALLRERGVDAVYVVAGEGEERARLEGLAKDLGVDDRVFFPGYIENASENLSGFDVFVLPSIKEGTPYSLMEAARAGMPIVATQAIDKEFAEDIHNMRLVPSADAIAIADAIAELSRLPRTSAKRDELFPLSAMLRETFALYNQ